NPDPSTTSSGLVSLQEYLAPQPTGVPFPIWSSLNYDYKGSVFFGQLDSNGSVKKFLVPDGTDYSSNPSGFVSNTGRVSVAQSEMQTFAPYTARLVLSRSTMERLNNNYPTAWSTMVLEDYGFGVDIVNTVSVDDSTVLYAGVMPGNTRFQVFYRKCV